MKLILCLDKDNGMLFNHRRLSQDRNMMLDMSTMIKSDKIYMNDYSYDLYQNLDCPNKIVVESLDNIDDYCLIENQEIKDISNVEQVIIYNWNRKYPADLYFPISLLEKWNIKETYDFAGTSHDVITKTVYERG